MTLLSQEEIELKMYHGGIRRAEVIMSRAEEAGSADRNPYGQEVMREFVLPIAERIRADVAAKGTRGPRAAHIQLLAPLDADAVAFLAVRCALNVCMDPTVESNERTLGNRIGSTIHGELILVQIDEHNPDLFYVMSNDLGRRLSKSERHRVAVMRDQARKANIELVEWPIGARAQVGMYLQGLLIEAGMLTMDETRKQTPGRRPGSFSSEPRGVALTPEIQERIGQIKGFVALTAPTYGPCVEPPMDWTSPTDGGWHTPKLRRAHPLLVRCHPSARHLYREAAMPTVLGAVNALQRTKWRINRQMLKFVQDYSAAGGTSEEIVSQDRRPKPPPPHWLTPDSDKTAWSEEQHTEFKLWKRTVAEWHTEAKLLGSRWGRFYAATRTAQEFKEYPALHFVYFADSRGRLYPMTYGVNPQGSDIQKSLLHFAEGKPLDSPDALRWFHIHGANKFGFDKADLSERFMWTHERREWLLQIAADPINNEQWKEADSPLQFLAWVFEYAAWVYSPETFVSHIPISMDGSCNGLQNLSAMLRDEIGGRATNLTDNEVMQDIYRLVADAAMVRLRAMQAPPGQEHLLAKWLAHGVSRSVVKRSVMTTPYGVTLRSASDYVVDDYLRKHENPFDKPEYRAAASLLMSAVWPAIGDVVVKGREAMDWLKKSAGIVLKGLDPEEEPLIWWTSPSGFPASQTYFDTYVHRIMTRLLGESRIRILSETDAPDRFKHASGLAPNFVHSMDAAHLHLVAAMAPTRGIDSLAMIHDDYGTHAADSQKLYEVIREQFVLMYEFHDPIQQFFDKYGGLPTPPKKGELDIQEVRRSKFFFS